MQEEFSNERPLSDDLLEGAAAAASFLGLERRVVYRLASQDELPVIRKGGKMFFRKSELERAFTANSAQAA